MRCAGIKYDRFLTVELYTHTADPHAAAREEFRVPEQSVRRMSPTCTPVVTLFTKPGCGLCEEAEELIEAGCTLRGASSGHRNILTISSTSRNRTNILDDPGTTTRRYGEH